MQTQRGFTLIELVVVIIVLGILAVTAAPKFIDLQTDARVGTLNGAKGALQGANALVYSKSAINNLHKQAASGSDTVTLYGTTKVTPLFGYLRASKDDVANAVELDSSWVVAVDDATTPTKVFIYPSGVTFDKDETGETGASCHLSYTPAGSEGASPTYSIVKGKC
ncbi:MSHA pilin protein MshA [Ferrimonas sediminum]|uniref:MSHA pilin protein MshA n=1 Tax=Ferrimonas sediminum TaxID=718193 RepID=A0A1G8K8Q0_9GAMM|nr:prepilin-type N-terminal cleavage/methylation domain-containing protein [Ferrimonas sediminum]SDI39791.1 MSHA pilin protein MshA [Ferrimonas sediminum]